MSLVFKKIEQYLLGIGTLLICGVVFNIAKFSSM
jgi:hypothetical protein